MTAREWRNKLKVSRCGWWDVNTFSTKKMIHDLWRDEKLAKSSFERKCDNGSGGSILKNVRAAGIDAFSSFFVRTRVGDVCRLCHQINDKWFTVDGNKRKREKKAAQNHRVELRAQQQTKRFSSHFFVSSFVFFVCFDFSFWTLRNKSLIKWIYLQRQLISFSFSKIDFQRHSRASREHWKLFRRLQTRQKKKYFLLSSQFSKCDVKRSKWK